MTWLTKEALLGSLNVQTDADLCTRGVRPEYREYLFATGASLSYDFIYSPPTRDEARCQP